MKVNYIKLYEAYFDNSDSETWELIDYAQYISFDRSHNTIMNYDYDKELNMFDSIYELYPKEGGDFDNNQYKLNPSTDAYHLRLHNKVQHNKSFCPNSFIVLEIYLVPKKTDIFISAYEDEWYTIKFCKYRKYEDVDYTSTIYYIADGLQGLKDWLDNVLNS